MNKITSLCVFGGALALLSGCVGMGEGKPFVSPMMVSVLPNPNTPNP